MDGHAVDTHKHKLAHVHTHAHTLAHTHTHGRTQPCVLVLRHATHLNSYFNLGTQDTKKSTHSDIPTMNKWYLSREV